MRGLTFSYYFFLGSCSRSSSSSSLNSLTSDIIRTPSSPTTFFTTTPTGSPVSPLRTQQQEWNDNNTTTNVKTPLREQQPNKQSKDWNKTVITDTLVVGKVDLNTSNNKGKNDDTFRESIIQTTKAIDYSRRNSYSDLSNYLFFFGYVYKYSK